MSTTAYDNTMHIQGFIQKDNKTVWVLTGNLLLVLDLVTKQLSKPLQPVAKMHEWGIRNYLSFIKDDNNNLWINTSLHGIICYNIGTGSSEIYSGDNKDSNIIAANNIKCMAYDRSGRLWYGSVKSSCLAYYDTKNKKDVILDMNGHSCDKANSVKTYNFLNIDGNIYACTEAGFRNIREKSISNDSLHIGFK